jgi:hypothetical protein
VKHYFVSPVIRGSRNLFDKFFGINKSVRTSFWHQRRVKDAVKANWDLATGSENYFWIAGYRTCPNNRRKSL